MGGGGGPSASSPPPCPSNSPSVVSSRPSVTDEGGGTGGEGGGGAGASGAGASWGSTLEEAVALVARDDLRADFLPAAIVLVVFVFEFDVFCEVDVSEVSIVMMC